MTILYGGGINQRTCGQQTPQYVPTWAFCRLAAGHDGEHTTNNGHFPYQPMQWVQGEAERIEARNAAVAAKFARN